MACNAECMPINDTNAPVSRVAKRPPLPEGHAAYALADINDVEALTRMKRSWIYEEVRLGRFPAPVIRQPRCTRWLLADIRAWVLRRIAAN